MSAVRSLGVERCGSSQGIESIDGIEAIERRDGVERTDPPAPQRAAQREQAIRMWIARKESVCPYAPGLAHFVHLPEISSMRREHMLYFAEQLQIFYASKEQGKRVGRWMLLPHKEWSSHAEAHTEAERIFWVLNAAYFHLLNDEASVTQAMRCALPGYNRGYKGDILNPVVGHQPDPLGEAIPARSLFYSALSPLYRSKQFYRYSPASIIPLVYASEFQELKRKHAQVTQRVTFEMACGGLFELFGDDLPLDREAFQTELPLWGAMIDRIAEIMRAAKQGKSSFCASVKGCPASNLSYFRLCPPKLAQAFYDKYAHRLSTLRLIMQRGAASPKQIIGAAFAGSGLYTLPDYL